MDNCCYPYWLWEWIGKYFLMFLYLQLTTSFFYFFLFFFFSHCCTSSCFHSFFLFNHSGDINGQTYNKDKGNNFLISVGTVDHIILEPWLYKKSWSNRWSSHKFKGPWVEVWSWVGQSVGFPGHFHVVGSWIKVARVNVWRKKWRTCDERKGDFLKKCAQMNTTISFIHHSFK